MKSGHYMTVKLALNSKEEYNLDQEVCSVMVFFFLNTLMENSSRPPLHFNLNAARFLFTSF